MKKLIIALLVVGMLAGLGNGMLNLINSRSFQFYGNLISRVETDRKIVALTFDDGPTGNTEAVIEILEELDVKATFFVTGRELEENPEQGRMLVEAGHELGNHSYSHTRMAFKSPGFVREEIDRTNELIREAGYTGTIHFRPPYGKKLIALPRYLNAIGMTTVMWDVEPETHPEIAASAGAITQHVMENVQPGSIILLHVMFDSRIESVKAITGIVTQLRSQGYEFVTVSEILELNE